MRKGGAIILTSSAANTLGFDGGNIYSATKAAVRSFARSMAVELGKQGIRVNSLSPGLIPTQFFSNSNLGASGYSQFENALVDQCALRRAGTPLEVANAAVFLGSDESSYVTAEDLYVDGGLGNT
jgi:NAD(P)-dependent dehydrogenase (short-subunit alcohol dehydrogenase family)